MTQSFEIISLSPPGLTDPSLAIAACRAGAVGVFNAELFSDFQVALGGVRYMSRFVSSPFGLKVDTLSAGLFKALDTPDRPKPNLLVLNGDLSIGKSVVRRMDKFRDGGGHICLEVTRWQKPERPDIEPHIDGWWVKGNEAGGFVREESAFILFQRVISESKRPVYVRGGIGCYNCAAYWAGGAAGIVLDSQLLMLRESPLKEKLAYVLSDPRRIDTVLVGQESSGKYLRILKTPGNAAVQALTRDLKRKQSDAAYIRSLSAACRWDHPEKGVVPLGQDSLFAKSFSEKFKNVAGMLKGLRELARDQVRSAKDKPFLTAGGVFAKSIGTRYPIIQGAMSRVSDVPGFAAAVSEAGAMPCLALGLMDAGSVRALLDQTRKAVGDRPMGVGLFGFAPAGIFKDQIEVLREIRPAFAYIAGGRPDQAQALEKMGVPTALHVPTAQLLELFMDQGARRFIFEGRECGGHIGPLSSMTLWQSVCEKIIDLGRKKNAVSDIQVIFAGGIHDSRSAAMVAALAAPLADAGISIGLLMGTAYLFTEEAVSTGAIKSTFQNIAMGCDGTVILTTGKGHASRCVPTAFADRFFEIKKGLRKKDQPDAEKRDALETIVRGRLRLAAKGEMRCGKSNALRSFDRKEQLEKGMYMIGQLASLKGERIRMKDLHQDVTDGAKAFLSRTRSGENPQTASRERTPVDIAIIGMASLLPGSRDVQGAWSNLLNKVSVIGEIPAHRWDWRLYYDKDRWARDKIYSKWGGFIDEIPFNPSEYGFPPMTLKHIEPLQLLSLEVVKQAMADAALDIRTMDRARTSVILGISGGTGDLGGQYAARSDLKRLCETLTEPLLARLPEWSEDSFAGILPSVSAGRIANRFDFGGTNFTVDAACASSLAAVRQAAIELASGNSDVVITGGVDTLQSPFAYLCFSKTQALSPRGRSDTFDTQADGIVLSEGLVVLVLKRLADAEQNGDRIYAVIKGIGASSDGRGKSLTAPSSDGQLAAISRAYEQAGYCPSTLGLIEAHGTGTVAGDTAEIETIFNLMERTDAAAGSCAVGSAKTTLGHTKAAAGAVGLMKAAMALHHKVLPPHGNIQQPLPRLCQDESPLYLCRDPVPWMGSVDKPRRAGVSAFGFGGTNFHVALEEYTSEYRRWDRSATLEKWPCELFAWRAKDKQALKEDIARTRALVSANSAIHLNRLSWSLLTFLGKGGVTGAVVAGCADELVERMDRLVACLEDGGSAAEGVYFGETGPGKKGKTAFLFPGQGSQYTGMLRELACMFTQVRSVMSRADRILGDFPDPATGAVLKLSRCIYPPDRYLAAVSTRDERRLRRTEIAQPAVGAASAGMFYLLADLGIVPDMCAGHSYGEFVALFASGAINFDELIELSAARGRIIVQQTRGGQLGAMAAVMADMSEIEKLVKDMPDIVAANHNSPTQVILSGPDAAIAEATRRLEKKSVPVTRLNVAAAFHSPIMEPAREAFAKYLAEVRFKRPNTPVYNNHSGRPHGGSEESIRQAMAEHMVLPVRFVDEIETMYRNGARIFLEVGPKNVLSRLVGQILGRRHHVAIGPDSSGGGLRGLLHMLGTLLTCNMAMDFKPLFAGRIKRPARDKDQANDTRWLCDAPLSDHIWLVSGGCARPLGGQICTGNHPMLTAEHVFETQKKGNLEMKPASEKNLTMKEVKTAFMDDADIGFAALPVSGSDREKGFIAFQETMRRFLDVQEKVMAHYLRSPSAHHPPFETGADEDLFDVHERSMIPASEGIITDGRVVSNATQTPPDPDTETTQVSEPSEQAASVPFSDQTDVRRIFLNIVCERTGYPEDMLGLDQDIEADLGIDSIKRVEILSAFQKVLPEDAAARMRERMEEITAMKTLGEIVQWLGEIAQSPVAQDMPQPEEQNEPEGKQNNPFKRTGSEPDCSCSPLPRFVVREHEEPVAWIGENDPQPGLCIITPDGAGIGEKLSALLKAAGTTAAVLPEAALTDETALVKWAERTKAAGKIGSLVHLAPVGRGTMPDAIDLNRCREQRVGQVNALFVLLRVTGPGFIKNGGRVLSISDMGGFFGRDYSPKEKGRWASPWGGGLSGLIKTITIEWNSDLENIGFWAKAIDLDPAVAPDQQAACIYRELTLPGGRREVGYPKGRRTVFRTVPASLTPLRNKDRIPDRSWVVFATGGARGITAETLKGLLCFRPRLVVVGRTPLPESESATTRNLKTDGQLRAHFIKILKKTDAEATPAQVEKAIRALKKNREISANIGCFSQAGCTVDYRCCDMTDENAVAGLMADLYETYGRIDAVIHGAGIIEDKLLVDKATDSIDRVIQTKVDSALLLAKYLQTASLKFLAFFTSVAGRYGNRGQTDYSVANEIVNRLAWILRGRFGDRVKIAAINWGPWEATAHGSGMVTPEAKRQFQERGVSLVPPEAGARFVFNELLYGDKNDVELVAGKGAWETMESAAMALPEKPAVSIVRDANYPLLIGARRLDQQDGAGSVEKTIDLITDPYLDHHRLDGIPVFPFAGAVEYMAEFVSHTINGNGVVTGLSNVRWLQGVTLNRGKVCIRLACARSDEPANGDAYTVEIRSQRPKQRTHYRGQVIAAPDFLPAEKYPLPTDLAPFPEKVRHIYERWLFHGPFFQTLREIKGYNDQQILAEFMPSDPSHLYDPPGRSAWIFDPALVDGMLQLFLVWCRFFQHASCLPVMIGKISRFGSRPLSAPLYVHLNMRSSPEDIALKGDCALVDAAGNLRMMLENIEGTASKKLNRLGGRWSGGMPEELAEIYTYHF